MSSENDGMVWQEERYTDTQGYQDGVYDGQDNALFTEYDFEGHRLKFAMANEYKSGVWARWTPSIPASGLYEIEVWVPTVHATSRNARYHIHGVKDQDGTMLVPVSQADFNGEWVSLGVHELDIMKDRPGRVSLNNLTGETGSEISFAGIRWRQYVEVQEPDFYLADGFDSPVGIGNVVELGPDGLWLDNPNPPNRLEWYMATDYNQRYRDSSGTAAIHTGIDMNLNPRGQWNKDKGQPVYAIASGIVAFAEFVPRYWGGIVIVKHDPLVKDGMYVVSRSAHLADIYVTEGQRIERGHVIGTVGSNTDRFGNSVGNEHLHFDISPTDALLERATDWPKLDQSRIFKDYLHPKEFIAANRPKTS